MQNKLYSGRSHICSALLKHGLSTFFSNPWVLWITLCDFYGKILYWCLPASYIIRGGLSAPSLPKAVSWQGHIHSKSSSKKYLLFFKGRKPEGIGNPTLRWLRSAARAGGCVRSNALRLGFATLPPPQSKSKKVLDKETNESSLCLFSEAARGLDINSLSVSIYFSRNQHTPYKRRYIFKKFIKHFFLLAFLWAHP
jgi:hypothetical protein